MTLLIAGVFVFFAIHMLPAFSLNTALKEKFGDAKYKIGFSLTALAGLLMIIFGMGRAEFVPLWTPLSFGRDLAIWLMPIVMILLSSADPPNNIRRFVRHPMLIGITLWGAVHLAANGDLASTILFASFLTFSVLDIILVETSGRFKPKEPVPVKFDVMVVAVGLVLYGLIFYFHGWIAGVPLV